jgi:hypothetical protein
MIAQLDEDRLKPMRSGKLATHLDPWATTMRLLTVLTFAFASALGACSSQQLYGAGQAWQRNECTRIPDVDQRQRCFQSTATSFDEYQRQQAAAKAGR